MLMEDDLRCCHGLNMHPCFVISEFEPMLLFQFDHHLPSLFFFFKMRELKDRFKETIVHCEGLEQQLAAALREKQMMEKK